MREKCPELFCTPYLSVFNPNLAMRTRITPNTGAFHAVNVIWCYLYVDLIFLKFEDNDKCTMDMKCTIKLWKKPQKIWLLNKSNLIFHCLISFPYRCHTDLVKLKCRNFKVCKDLQNTAYTFQEPKLFEILTKTPCSVQDFAVGFSSYVSIP